MRACDAERFASRPGKRRSAAILNARPETWRGVTRQLHPPKLKVARDCVDVPIIVSIRHGVAAHTRARLGVCTLVALADVPMHRRPRRDISVMMMVRSQSRAAPSGHVAVARR